MISVEEIDDTASEYLFKANPSSGSIQKSKINPFNVAKMDISSPTPAPAAPSIKVKQEDSTQNKAHSRKASYASNKVYSKEPQPL